MKSRLIYTQNDQDYLAEKHQMLENHISHASKIALLKIQSWKFAVQTPEVGTGYLQSVEDMLRNSLLSYVPPAHILCEEGYYFTPNEN
jgi:hypothetical protein